MLLVLFIQSGTGLFANDDIATTGPLYMWVSKAVSDRLTAIHRLNHDVIILLVSVHIVAVLFHLIYKKDDLITPMITGIKRYRGNITGSEPPQPWWLAAVTAAGAGGVVLLLVN
jgi:cytochrome b